MNERRKGLIICAVGIAVLWGLGHIEHRFLNQAMSEAKLSSTPVVGDVLAVEPVRDAPLKELLVKLRSGETVQVRVPMACVVFPGQVATLSRVHVEGTSATFYTFKESRERNDS